MCLQPVQVSLLIAYSHSPVQQCAYSWTAAIKPSNQAGQLPAMQAYSVIASPRSQRGIAACDMMKHAHCGMQPSDVPWLVDTPMLESRHEVQHAYQGQ